VLASPTGSGKTAILELAVCRAFTRNASGQYKIVYQAPIKALCSERQRDWQKKFSPLGLNCVELTGDSDSANLKHVQTADIIVTTPEKWDSITRKWKDHERLMRLIKLFLIDEVHILKEDRGAILEAVVSRMKTIGTDVRFVALSATVPNLDDVASWLGKTSAAPYHPANSEKFGEEFRPVKLTKHVCGYSGNTNDFAFESSLDHKLPEVIAKYSERKPIMIFCMTRNSTVSTAKMLALWWSANVQRRYWSEPSKPLNIQNQELRNCVASGVAFHHAGLDAGDRLNVEKAFLEGDVNVICCTSTLAVGVNLPCHFVIIKHTVTWTSTGAQEYSDLEIMQMIGRAGRPQFDNSAVAVIMTRQAKVRRYETMVTGQEVLESKLHHGLIEHLNAEIGLGTIRDLASARNWLSKTFLYVRIKQNPSYYKLEGARSGQHIDEQLDDICLRDLALLQGANLVADGQRFKCTDFGEAMARYYVNFETMRIIVGLQPGAQISEIVSGLHKICLSSYCLLLVQLSALSQASEFQDIRFRSGEKPFYKTLNSSPSIRFPIPVSLNLPAHKVSLIIQSVLGSADTAWDKDAQKHRAQYQNEVAAVFKHVHRLIRCIADCQISLGDSRAVMNALLLQRSLRAQAWDDGPLHMRQIPEIGVVAVRKLVTAGIRTIEELEFSEPHRIEMVLKRNPPFGLKLLEQVRLFPKLRVSIQVLTNTVWHSILSLGDLLTLYCRRVKQKTG
jgi:ATP-dependent DNA helicase HFM1/MER3